MTAVTLPNAGITAGYLANESGWTATMNKNLRTIDALLQSVVVDKDLTAPPGSPTAGAMWIVGPAATGAWSGQATKLAIWQVGDDITSAWLFITPKEGFLVYVLDEDTHYRFDGAAWGIFSAGGGSSTASAVSITDAGNYFTGTNVEAALQELGAGVSAPVATIASDLISYASDLTTALTTGVVGAFTPAPRAATLVGVKANLLTASSSGVVTLKIKKNGVTILSTDLSIDATELTSRTAATPAVISDTAIAADDIFTYEITAAGTGAKGLMVTLLTSTAITVSAPPDTSDNVTALSIASGVVTVDLSLGDYFTLALSANVTSWVFTNAPGSGKGYSKIIEITQDASAAKTMAMPTGTWDGTAPTISDTLSAVQLMSIISHNNGTTRRMNLSGVHA